MIYYHSATITGIPETRQALDSLKNPISVLISFFEFREEAYFRRINFFRSKISNLMLDSGAYSAFTRKKPIILEKYMDFIKKHRDYFTCYIALDVIGDERASIENYKIMLKNGLDPIPVWHPPFSSTDVLKEYLDLGAKYVCFGAIASALKAKGGDAMYMQLLPKIDKAFELLKQYPGAKVHGLGISSETLTCRYPWYSLDSSAMMIWAGYGHIVFKNKIYHVTGGSYEHKDYYLNPPAIRRDEFLAALKRYDADIELAKQEQWYRMSLSMQLYDEWILALPPAPENLGIQENLF